MSRILTSRKKALAKTEDVQSTSSGRFSSADAEASMNSTKSGSAKRTKRLRRTQDLDEILSKAPNETNASPLRSHCTTSKKKSKSVILLDSGNISDHYMESADQEECPGRPKRKTKSLIHDENESPKFSRTHRKSDCVSTGNEPEMYCTIDEPFTEFDHNSGRFVQAPKRERRKWRESQHFQVASSSRVSTEKKFVDSTSPPPRRRSSMRKRWSDEIRKSQSVRDVSTLWVCPEADERVDTNTGTNLKRRSMSMNDSLNIPDSPESTCNFSLGTRDESMSSDSEQVFNKIVVDPASPVDEKKISIINSTQANVKCSRTTFINSSDGGGAEEDEPAPKRSTFELKEPVTERSVLVNLSLRNVEVDKKRRSQSAADILSDPLNSSHSVELENSHVQLSDVEDGVECLPPSAQKKVRFQFVTIRRGARGTETASTATSAGVNLLDKRKSPKSKGNKLNVSCFTPPKVSSTPKPDTLLRQVLTKDTTGVCGNFRRRSRSADEANEKIQRKKIPNFAKIHQKASERMEDIAQLIERKAERARLLLSGQKPSNSGSSGTANNKLLEHKSTQRQLSFNKPAAVAAASSSKGFLRAVHIGNLEIKPLRCVKIGSPKITKNQAGGPSKCVQKARLVDSKGKNKRDELADQMKAVATKSKPKHDDIREERRNILKGVRGNRRFELLMKMRQEK